MSRALKSVRIWLAALALALAFPHAQATISSATSSPESFNVPAGQTSSFTVTWTVTTADGDSVSSSKGSFFTDHAIGAVNTLLTRAATAGSTVVFTETVFLPATVVLQAQKEGYATFYYQREFMDDDAVPSGVSVALTITSGLGAGFGITRQALSFDDGTPVRILARGADLHARALLNFNGTGLLQAMWEVAGPPGTGGEPIFRPLSQVRQHLSGGANVTLESPALPTDMPGLYLVRLRITDPATPFEMPVIRYFVGDEAPGHAVPPVSMALGQPANLALLGPDTRFTWEPVAKAQVYQLEIYSTEAGLPALPEMGGGDEPPAGEVAAAMRRPPVTGVLVPGQQTQTPLSGAVRAHLDPGGRYYWRLLAIGADGAVVGRSPVRELHLP